MKVLILGAGHRQIRWLPMVDGHLNGSEDWSDCEVTTLDINPRHNPDVRWDLNSGISLPFDANTFDELHAYEVLEHTGTQGDASFFFWQFSDFHRVLKPSGHLYGSVPQWNSMWALGDPSHRRIIPEGSFVFLDQTEYVRQVDSGASPMSDFRDIYHADFETMGLYKHGASLFFDLVAHKPSRTAPKGAHLGLSKIKGMA